MSDPFRVRLTRTQYDTLKLGAEETQRENEELRAALAALTERYEAECRKREALERVVTERGAR